MARSLTEATLELPKFVVAAGYAVDRLGETPSATVTLVEAVYILDTYTLDAVSGRVLSIGALADDETLVNRVIALPDSTLVGTVESSERVLVSSEPDVYTRQVTLVSSPLVTLTPEQALGVARQTPTGAPAYRQAGAGRSWQIKVPSTHPDGLARLLAMMGTIGFSMLKAGVQALMVSVTDADVLTAVQTLAAQGVNIDSFFGDQGDQLELDRIAGTIPWAIVRGNAPMS